MSELAVAVRRLADCPGPRGLPLLGNFHQLDVTRLSTVLEGWADRYGPLYRIRLGGRDALAVADVDAIHTMLRQRPDGYRRLHTIESVLAELGITGAFSAEGQDWRRLRRLAMQSLHADYLRRYSGTVARVTARLHERWARAAATAADVDVQQDMMRYTVDVIAGLSLGYDLNTLQDDSDPLQARLREFFPMVNRRVNAAFPYWRYVKLPADRRLDRTRAEIDTTVRDIIGAARLRRAADDRPPADMLEAMLAPQDGDAAFTDAEIAGTVITMLLAGQETTASTMSWMVHCVIEHPEVQARMREEADRVSGARRRRLRRHRETALHRGGHQRDDAAPADRAGPVPGTQPRHGDRRCTGAPGYSGLRPVHVPRPARQPFRSRRVLRPGPVAARRCRTPIRRA